VPVPASWFLGFWIATDPGAAALDPRQDSGVAWFAHIGGFAMGLLLVLTIRPADCRAVPARRARQRRGLVLVPPHRLGLRADARRAWRGAHAGRARRGLGQGRAAGLPAAQPGAGVTAPP
jgi:hypothetical protein